MKNQVRNLFCLAFLGIASLTTSCDNANDEFSIDAAPSGKSYQVFENHVELAGEKNMRDLGGYIGANGKRILYHKLYRSGELFGLTQADLNSLDKREIKQVVDLRNESERMEKPDKMINGATYFQAPLIADFYGSSKQSALVDELFQGTVKGKELMIPLYIDIDNLKITNWEKIFDLLETGNTTLLHCTNGKDRTGMTAALVLSSLGVDQETIINDFMASNYYLSDSNQQTINYYNSQYGQGVGQYVLPLIVADEEYINAFFHMINLKYGSIDNFLKILKVDTVKMRHFYLEK